MKRRTTRQNTAGEGLLRQQKIASVMEHFKGLPVCSYLGCRDKRFTKKEKTIAARRGMLLRRRD